MARCYSCVTPLGSLHALINIREKLSSRKRGRETDLVHVPIQQQSMERQ